jgi:hypothetical protein
LTAIANGGSVSAEAYYGGAIDLLQVAETPSVRLSVDAGGVGTGRRNRPSFPSLACSPFSRWPLHTSLCVGGGVKPMD